MQEHMMSDYTIKRLMALEQNFVIPYFHLFDMKHLY